MYRLSIALHPALSRKLYLNHFFSWKSQQTQENRTSARSKRSSIIIMLPIHDTLRFVSCQFFLTIFLICIFIIIWKIKKILKFTLFHLFFSKSLNFYCDHVGFDGESLLLQKWYIHGYTWSKLANHVSRGHMCHDTTNIESWSEKLELKNAGI